MGTDAVFLHAFWRTGSTWLWSRFRALDETHCFYEPYHYALASIDLPTLETFGSKCWDSGHALTQPYFSEYKDLIAKDGGVCGFRQDFSVELFFPNGKLDNVEAKYLFSLIQHALELQKRPVLGFCRSLGRAGAMRKEFEGVHIVLIREPFSVLNSVIKKGMLSDYAQVFLSAQFLDVCSKLNIPVYKRASVSSGDRAKWSLTRPRSSARNMLMLYLLGCFVGLLYSDIVLDVDLISRDQDEMRRAEAQVLKSTDLQVSFSNCSIRTSFDAIRDDLFGMQSLEQELENHLFSRGEELASRIAQLQGAEPLHSPQAQMDLLKRIFIRSRDRFVADDATSSKDLCVTDAEALARLEERLIDLEEENERLKSSDSRRIQMEQTLSWRVTRPLRSKFIARLRGRGST